MASYTYLAVRTPDEFKGVYHGEENIRKVFEKIQGMKGVSTRTFGKKQEDEALKWAGVKGLADVPQIAITKVKNVHNAKNENEDVSGFEYIINHYAKQKYTTADIKLVSGRTIMIQIRDIYYIGNRSLYNNYSYDTKENENSTFYSSRRNDKTYRFEDYYDVEKFEKYKKDIKVFKATKMNFLKDGLAIENYDTEDIKIDSKNVSHSHKDLYIPFSAIETIQPTGFWNRLKTKITDENIIKDCEKFFKG